MGGPIRSHQKGLVKKQHSRISTRKWKKGKKKKDQKRLKVELREIRVRKEQGEYSIVPKQCGFSRPKKSNGYVRWGSLC